jgi:hypothetical protein
MPYIHDTPRQSPESQEVTVVSQTREQRILANFYAGASPSPAGLELSCKMHVTTDKAGPLEYNMQIILNKLYPPSRVQWLGPLGKVRIFYFTECQDAPVLEREHELEFADNHRLGATFHANMHRVRWNEFLIVGIEFAANTIHCTFDTTNNRVQQGIRRRTIETIQKRHFKTIFNRDPVLGIQDNSIYARELTNQPYPPSSSGPSSGSESVEAGEIQSSVESESSNSEA